MANREGFPGLMQGNPWVYLNNEAYLKLWIKNNNVYDKQLSVLVPVENKTNWFRQYKLPLGMKFEQLKTTSVLIPTNNYVDNSYDSVTHSLTGQVYENVLFNELNNVQILNSKKTK